MPCVNAGVRSDHANVQIAKERQDGRDFSDWSRKGPLPELPGQQRRVSDRPGFQGRSFDNMSDAGSERGGRRPFEQGDGKLRDFSNWERKGPLSPVAAAAPSLREGGRQRSKDGPAFRKSSPAWGEGTGRSQDGSRPPRREYQEKPAERAPTAPELDNQWRTKMRPDPVTKSPTPSREPSNPPSPAPAPLPATRPKLNLQKRTVSEAEPASSPVASTSATDSKPSPFGGARPVDTSIKEKEIAEKRELAVRQKREADEKAKAERAEEKRVAQQKTLAEKNAKESSAKTGKEKERDTSAEPKQSGKNFEILRRTSEGVNGLDADDETAEGEDVVAPTDDKAVKPVEVTRAAPARHVKDVRKEQQTSETAQPNKTTAERMDENGWSTVSSKPRNNRRSNQAARAIAS